MFEDRPVVGGAQPPKNLPTEPVDMFAGVDSPAGGDLPPVPPNALSAGLLKRKDGMMPPMNTASTTMSMPEIPPMNDLPPGAIPSLYPTKQPVLGKILFAVILCALLAGGVMAGWWVYTTYVLPAKTPVVNKNTTGTADPDLVNVPAVTPSATLPVAATNTASSTPNNAVTSTSSTTADATDVPEQIKSEVILFGEPIDSDKDGLDDEREKDFKTNPNNPDTDKDGLSDGDEVLIWHTDPLNSDTDGDTFLDGEEVKHGYNPLGPGKLTPAQVSVMPTSTVNNKVTTSSTATGTVKAK